MADRSLPVLDIRVGQVMETSDMDNDFIAAENCFH